MAPTTNNVYNNQIYSVKLQFYQWEYPIAVVGGIGLNSYDYYQLHTRVCRRAHRLTSHHHANQPLSPRPRKRGICVDDHARADGRLPARLRQHPVVGLHQCQITQRNNQYNMSQNAAEAAVERVIGQIDRDFISQRIQYRRLRHPAGRH